MWAEEVLPVFAADGLGGQAEAYVASVRDRFLKHRLADIADNHQAKKLRRMRPVVERAGALGLDLAQPRLRAHPRLVTRGSCLPVVDFPGSNRKSL